MTMLDTMRRHRNILKWTLALVVLAFVLLYIPSFLNTGAATGGAASADTLATVEGKTISAADFRRRYQAQVNAYRTSYGGNLTDALLRQMQVPQQVLQQMIQENAEVTEAERQGIKVSDAEVRAAIFSIPGLQENGHFIGEDRYRQLLRAQDPPMLAVEGYAGLQLPDAIRRGAVGSQPGCSFTELYQQIWGCFAEGREAEGDRLHGELLPFVSYWMQDTELIIAAEKYISVRRGWFAEPYCRAPAHRLDAEEVRVIDVFLARFADRLPTFAG